MQMSHSGIFTVKGERAMACYAIQEQGRCTDSSYDDLSVYDDGLVRETKGWRVVRRSYSYRFLDQTPFSDTA